MNKIKQNNCLNEGITRYHSLQNRLIFKESDQAKPCKIVVLQNKLSRNKLPSN